MVNNGKDDKELNDYLEGKSDISNHYRVSNKIEPSTYMDKKILSAAKQAVTDTKQKSKVVFHKSPWALPVSIAAVITLSVSLVVTMQQETGQPLISGPELEMIDSGVLLEKKVTPQTITADDGRVLDEIEVKQSSVERVDESSPAAFDAAGDYRLERDVKALKKESAIQPAKKPLLKENARSEVSEERVFARERLLISEPAEAELGAVMELKQDRQFSQQENELLKIKALWEQGNHGEAKQLFDKFLETHPDYSEEAIKEVVGEELLQLIRM